MDTHNLYRFVWTQRAVDRYVSRRTFDLRHTVSNVAYDVESPWLQADMSDRSGGSAWLLVDRHGRIVADGPHSV